MWKGLAICAALSGGGYALARLAGGGISPLVFALALGVLVGNLPLVKLHPLHSTIAFLACRLMNLSTPPSP